MTLVSVTEQPAPGVVGQWRFNAPGGVITVHTEIDNFSRGLILYVSLDQYNVGSKYRAGGKVRYALNAGYTAPQLTGHNMGGIRLLKSTDMWSKDKLISDGMWVRIRPAVEEAVGIAAATSPDVELALAMKAVNDARAPLEYTQSRYLASQAEYLKAMDALASLRLAKGVA